MEERFYTINLRKGFINVSPTKRAKRAINEIRKFIKRHTKAKIVKIDTNVNLFIWRRGAKNPPPKIRVRVSFEKGKEAFVTLAE